MTANKQISRHTNSYINLFSSYTIGVFLLDIIDQITNYRGPNMI